ncbi:hypothetical protein KIN20_018641 [Parelaphostrongylus tenuis]|uniref:Uncharacterized protein n=1 Tax=Parelaphostrongylus tenuis TaxID=148309 RepID=A0AAD5MNB2_PARTN|nr:hypothetical protein KIN20_018641 [Parelaphostrongylus tenuis]
MFRKLDRKNIHLQEVAPIQLLRAQFMTTTVKGGSGPYPSKPAKDKGGGGRWEEVGRASQIN